MTAKTTRRLKEKERFEKVKAEDGVRFHIKSGPTALFQRTQDILQIPCRLEISKHARERIEERAQEKISESMLEEIRNFDPAVWRLFSVSCGPNGRFRETFWRVKVGGRVWTVVRGVNRFQKPPQLVTAYLSNLDRPETPHARKYAKKGEPFYKAVEALNTHFISQGIRQGGADEKTIELQKQCKVAFQFHKGGGNVCLRQNA